jgi:dihydroorotate dehydrogenase
LKYPVSGVIFGNLQKNKQDSSLDQKEVARFAKGNFSGKPTEKRSNELISLAYKTCGEKLIVIGCGGVFNAEDAYKKIKLGASLVQMITGMIFEGPQVISDINLGLVKLLKTDGYKNISEAIGKE